MFTTNLPAPTAVGSSAHAPNVRVVGPASEAGEQQQEVLIICQRTTVVCHELTSLYAFPLDTLLLFHYYYIVSCL